SCQYEDGASYRGTVSVTNTGKTCQRWDSQTPHEHIKTPGAYPSAGLERNYCRNPDGELGVWCFTTDPNSRWELCDVPSCVSCQYEDGASYRGTVSVTNTGKTCQRWDSQTPHEHIKTPGAYPSAGLERNYCRNPDGELGVWCFTTDPNSRWELCDVPSCALFTEWTRLLQLPKHDVGNSLKQQMPRLYSVLVGWPECTPPPLLLLQRIRNVHFVQ
ncbi:hypothetical protein Bbelb_133050, partial [Branchiostoma belcheri]